MEHEKAEFALDLDLFNRSLVYRRLILPNVANSGVHLRLNAFDLVRGNVPMLCEHILLSALGGLFNGCALSAAHGADVRELL